jgi:hypothetical protein
VWADVPDDQDWEFVLQLLSQLNPELHAAERRQGSAVHGHRLYIALLQLAGVTDSPQSCVTNKRALCASVKQPVTAKSVCLAGNKN